MTDNAEYKPSWWPNHMRLFDGLEIHPSELIGLGYGGKEVLMPCKPERATCWVVYGLYRLYGVKGGYEMFAVFKNSQDAAAFCIRLFKRFPHLVSGRPASKPTEHLPRT